jgi:hypothetical protein
VNLNSVDHFNILSHVSDKPVFPTKPIQEDA